MIERERSNISLAEEFTERAWQYYDSYEAETKEQLAFQRHVDLRTFMPSSGEGWTTGTFGYLAAVARYPAIAISAEGLTESESATPNHPVDLLSGFSDTDRFTFALPKFPLESINLIQSRIEITSDPQGHCSNTKLTAVVSLSESIKTIIEGDSQFVIERSALQQREIDLGAVTGVRFKIVCNEGKSGTVYVMGIKLVLAPVEGEPGWIVSTVDFDNWNDILRKPTPLNGDTTSGPVLNQGILWKSDLLPGYNDPRPVDAEFGIVVNPGSQTQQNEIALYMRQEPLIFQTQLDLIGITQSELDGRPQPDLGTEEFASRTVGELDKQSMSRFDHLEQMKDLERLSVANPVEQSWISFSLKWGEGKTKITLANSISPGYIFPKIPMLESNSEHLIICSLEDTSARVRIYPLNKDKSVSQVPVFDSTLIDDDGVFRRRQGRIGWKAILADNDAYVRSIRPRKTTFAEYKSTPLISFTPVSGGQLFADFSGDEELWTGEFVVFPENSPNVILSRDLAKTTDTRVPGGENTFHTHSKDVFSFRVETNGTENVGIQTDFMNFLDFSQTQIQFNIWFNGTPRSIGKKFVVRPKLYGELEKTGEPKYSNLEALYDIYGDMETLIETTEETLESNIIARLESAEGTIFPLNMPELETNQWQQVVLRIPDNSIMQNGLWRLQIIQPTHTPSTWWVDGIFILEKMVQWSARSVVNDPWKSNYAPWTDFREIANVNRKAILLYPRGKELQLRARALRQNATIKNPKIIPKYSHLGRLVWPEENLSNKVAPESVFSIEPISARSFIFIDESKEGTAAIVAREWDFGDGSFLTGNQQTVEHHYTQEGKYYVTLVTIDRNGLRNQVTHTVEVF